MQQAVQAVSPTPAAAKDAEKEKVRIRNTLLIVY